MSNLASKFGADTLEKARARWEEHCTARAAHDAAWRAGRIAEGHAVPPLLSDFADIAYRAEDDPGGVSNLLDLARALSYGDGVYWADWTDDSYALAQLCHEEAERDGPPFNWAHDAEYQPGLTHHWALLEDTDPHRGRVPASLSNRAGLVAFAKQWRESHRSLRGRELAVWCAPGGGVVFAIWSPVRLTEEQTRALAWDMSGDFTATPRFRAVAFPFKMPDAGYDRGDELSELYAGWMGEEFTRLQDGIYLPADVVVAASKTLPRASSVARAAGESPKLLTGIGALDSLAHGAPGIARGALVVAAGLEGSGKSSLFFEVAETDLAAGSVVLWVAHDESDRRIRQRQLKRRGLSAAEAERLPASELAKLEPLDFFVIGAGEPLEISWQAAYECADGRPLTVVVDSLQKVNMAGLDDHGQRERIDAALRAIQACQVRWPATVLATSEATSSGKAKGSTGIGHAADMVLELSRARAAEVVRVTVSKNRDGAEGTIEVVLDRGGQRVLDPAAAAKAKAGAQIQARIVAAVSALGAKATGQRIEQEIEGVDNKAVRSELANMVLSGAVLHVGKAYQLPA